jgi:hypothetical protein
MKLFDRVRVLQDCPRLNVVAGMTGTLMEVDPAGFWGVVELDDEAISATGHYCVTLPLDSLETVMGAIAA